MTARIRVTTMVLASVAVALAGGDESGGSTVTAELRRLRVEILELRIELQERRIPELQRELDAIGLERRRIEQEMQLRQEALAEMDRQFAGADVSAEDRAELERRRAEMGANAADSLRVQHSILIKRETEMRARLEFEFNRWQSLTIQKLKAGGD